MKRAFTLLVAASLFTHAALGAGPTYISGVVSGTLALSNSPYVVTADISVLNGQTLTIEPGVVLQFTNVDVGAIIDGTLIAQGTAGSPILFTSDDVVKQPGQWRVLFFTSSSGSNSIMEHCIVECGAALAGGYGENIRVDTPAAPRFTNCISRLSAGHGLTLYGADARVQNCTFNNNSNNAVAMRADSLPVLGGNTATGNGRNAIGVFGSYISRTGTWLRGGIPYTIYEEAVVNTDVTLTIEPGTVIQFERVFDGFYVNGTLIAQGTAGNPILFTSDDVVKQPGQWRVLLFTWSASSNSIMEHCIVECGAASVGGYVENIRVDTPAAPRFTNCISRLSAGHGLTLYGADARVQNCTFNNNSNNAVAMRSDSLPVLGGNTAAGNGRNAIGVFGSYISRTGTWLRDGIPYTIYEDTLISSGVTLTLQPGTLVQFEDVFDGLGVDGTLVARGTAMDPIVFTSDDAIKQPGQWKALNFRSTASNSVMENCIVECAAAPASGLYANVQFESAPPVLITNCTIRNSFTHGMIIYGSDPRVVGCTFTNNGTTNGGFAMAMRADSLPLFRTNTAAGNGKNAIGVFGLYVTRTGTWMRDNLPYTIYEEALINSGVTLTIEPGTVVQFERVFDGFYVDGTLVARGTALDPIVFTSDDAVKQPGQWRVLNFRPTATNSVMEHCVVEYGASVSGGYNGSLQFDSAPVVLITNCIIRNSTNDGVFCYASSPLIRNCLIADNARDGVRTFNGAMPILTNCTFTGNTGFGVNNLDTTKIILAEGNYWGHSSGPFDNSNADGLGLVNPGGLGNNVSEYVYWGPFLTSGQTVVDQEAVLDISRAGNQAVLSWASTLTGYILQSSTNSPAGTNAWAAVTNPPVVINFRNTVPDALAGERKYYRLFK